MYQFYKPKSVDEATLLLSEKKNLRILAGGTDLIVALKNGIATCDFMMDIKKIPALRKISMTDEGLEIGAAVCIRELIDSGLLNCWYKALLQSGESLANVLLRNRATLVGNICNASPAGDMLPSSLVLGGQLHIAGRRGNRIIPLKEFFTGVKKHVLAPDEMVVKIVYPKGEGVSAFKKKKRIQGHDLAQVSVSASYSKQGFLKIAFGSAAPTPLLMEIGTFSADELLSKRAEIIDKAMESAAPIGDVRSSKDYRMSMLRYLTAEVIDEISR